jgi:long-chain acyl-CoA synthetase
MFLDLDCDRKSKVAVVDDSGTDISYGELSDFSKELFSAIKKRTLIIILTENCIGSLVGYIASLSYRVVPLLLSSKTDREMIIKMINTYQPEYIWVPESLAIEFNYQRVYQRFEYVLLKTELKLFELYDYLSLLLTTSGSTGSPKVVRHSYTNIESSARNVAAFFELTPDERAIVVLPMHHTMGLSVINSHLFAGATILLTKETLMDMTFWSFIDDQRATSFTGVPYSFEVLHKLRFFNMDLPDLKLLSQGGGKLKDELFKAFADFAKETGKKFIATYGQTEGSGRMAFLSADAAINKIGSIGKAIPGGHISLVDENNKTIKDHEAVGELVYRGPNVTLGYALNGEDLLKGDVNCGTLRTGDIARRDKAGYYYIVGRKNRFLKLYGFRIGLDETEQMIKSAFDIDCFCSGNDEKMIITLTDINMKETVQDYVVEKTGLFHRAIEVVVTDKIPRNLAGKLIYSA